MPVSCIWLSQHSLCLACTSLGQVCCVNDHKLIPEWGDDNRQGMPDAMSIKQPKDRLEIQQFKQHGTVDCQNEREQQCPATPLHSLTNAFQKVQVAGRQSCMDSCGFVRASERTFLDVSRFVTMRSTAWLVSSQVQRTAACSNHNQI